MKPITANCNRIIKIEWIHDCVNTKNGLEGNLSFELNIDCERAVNRVKRAMVKQFRSQTYTFPRRLVFIYETDEAARLEAGPN